MELVLDTLDQLVEEGLYQTEPFKRVLKSIQSDTVSPDEAFRLKDEFIWEKTKQDARHDGLEKGMLQGLEKGMLQGLEKGML